MNVFQKQRENLSKLHACLVEKVVTITYLTQHPSLVAFICAFTKDFH